MESTILLKQLLKGQEEKIAKRLTYLDGEIAFAGFEVVEEGGLGVQLAQRDLNSKIKDEVLRKLTEVRHCLQRIDEGTYGACVSCGEKISLARLQVIPTASHCLDCKNE